MAGGFAKDTFAGGLSFSAIFGKKDGRPKIKNTGILPEEYGQSSRRIRAIFQKNTGNLPKEYGQSSRRIRAISQKNTGNLPEEYGQSSRRIRAIFQKNTGNLKKRIAPFFQKKGAILYINNPKVTTPLPHQ